MFAVLAVNFHFQQTKMSLSAAAVFPVLQH